MVACQLIGERFPDIIIGEDEIILELKAAMEIIDAHRAQILSYMNAAKIQVGLILNFGPQPGIRRFLLDENGKQVRLRQLLSRRISEAPE